MGIGATLAIPLLRFEPASFRFVAQHLNHCANAVPGLNITLVKNGNSGREMSTCALILYLQLQMCAFYPHRKCYSSNFSQRSLWQFWGCPSPLAKIPFFRNLKPRHLVIRFRPFETTFLVATSTSVEISKKNWHFLPWRWDHYVCSKRQEAVAHWRGIITRKNRILTF